MRVGDTLAVSLFPNKSTAVDYGSGEYPTS